VPVAVSISAVVAARGQHPVLPGDRYGVDEARRTPAGGTGVRIEPDGRGAVGEAQHDAARAGRRPGHDLVGR